MSSHSRGRNTPEWFGGGLKTATVGNDQHHHDNSNQTFGTTSRDKKKKHRRSKSDTSYLKSSSRKAAERERREKAKDKSGKHKKHRRGRSSSQRDVNSSSASAILEHAAAASSSSESPKNNSDFMPSSLSMRRDETRPSVSSSSPTNEESNVRESHCKEQQKPSSSSGSSSHKRSDSVPTSRKKRSGSFIERLLGFGRSDTISEANTSASSLIDQHQHKHPPPSTEPAESSIHFHVHKIEEKTDPEDLHALALGHKSSSSTLSISNHDIPEISESFPKPNNYIHNNNPYLASHSQIGVINHHHHHNQQEQLQRLQQPILPYQKSIFFNPTNSAIFDHGAESDDLLTYSDDDTANSIPYNPYQQQAIVSNSLYPSYQSSEDFRNHESYQVRQQQRLMAMSNSQTSLKSAGMSNFGSGGNLHSTYGSINSLTTNESLPPLRRDQQYQQQQQQIYPKQQQDRFYMLSHTLSNDMYISEDDTLTSAHTQETFRNVDNFYFGRIRPNDKMQPQNEGERKLLLRPMVEDVKGEQESSPNSVNELSDELLDVTMHMDNTGKNLASQYDDYGGNQSASATFDEINVATPTTTTMESMRSSSHREDIISSSSSSSNNMKTPPARSHSSNSAKGSNNNGPPTPMRSKSHPPPPISSVQIVRNTTGIETTIASASSSSPHIVALRNSSSSSSQKMQRSIRSSLKEKKRLQKKVDSARKIEDHVRFLLQEYSNSSNDDNEIYDWADDLNNVYSNLDAGFFPKLESSRNVFFTVLFAIQLSAVVFLSFRYANVSILHHTSGGSGANPFKIEDDDPFSTGAVDPFSTGTTIPTENSPISVWAKDIYVDYANALQLSCITALYSTVLSALAIGMMMILSTAFIPTVLCVTVISCILSGTLMMALSPYTVMPVVALAALAISLAYSIVVWDRISFATTNLHTALVGIKSSADILLVGFSMMLVAFLWTMIWMVAFLSIYDYYLDDAEHELKISITYEGLGVSSAMIMSYIWTLNVIMNIVNVTVAGVIGSWWTSADSLSSCCTSAFREHFVQAVTKSFGSICFGSLVVPPLDLLNFFLLFVCPQTAQSHSIPLDHSSHDVGSMIGGDKSVRSDTSPSTIYSQMSSPLDGVTRYFNDFGFTYIGLYRHGFIQSSEIATDVFKAREWSGVVSDRLIPNVLRIISLLITFGSGFFGLVVEEYDGYSFTNFQKPTSTAFIIGCFIGFMLSSVCMKIVESAVNAVLVCFSVAPYPFKHFHPVLSSEMRASWGVVWLDEVVPVVHKNDV